MTGVQTCALPIWEGDARTEVEYRLAWTRTILKGAGFDDVRFASENIPEFGVDHAETWSLPIVARKGKLLPSVTEVTRNYAQVTKRNADLERELESLQAEYERHIRVMVEAGLIPDATMIWWDLRPSARYPTLETRIMDVCTNMEDALCLAALAVCSLRMVLRG